MSRLLLTFFLTLASSLLMPVAVKAQLNCPGGQPACAADVQQCPDGSFVSRTGCNCEFAACPQEIYASPSPTPVATCEPRPTCLDADLRFRCYPPEPAEGWCPLPSPTPSITPSPSDNPCVRAGCSGQLCISQAQASQLGGIATTCLYRPEDACYQQAACELQANGQCGFTQTAELTACLDPGPAEILAGDLNHDQTVNLLDYSLFTQTYTGQAPFNLEADFNQDDTLNLLDYSLFIQYYSL